MIGGFLSGTTIGLWGSKPDFAPEYKVHTFVSQLPMIGSTVCFMHVVLYGMLYRTARSRFHPSLPTSQLLPCLIISHTRPRMKSPQTYATVSSLSSCVSPGIDLLYIVIKDQDVLRDDVDVEPHVVGDGIIGTSALYLVWKHTT